MAWHNSHFQNISDVFACTALRIRVGSRDMSLLNLNTSIAFTIERAEKTRAAQSVIQAAWVWPLKTIAQWDADLEQCEGGVLNTLAYKALMDDAAYSLTQTAMQSRMDVMHARTLQLVGVMRARMQANPLLSPTVSHLSANGNTWRSIEEEGEDVLAAWKVGFAGGTLIPSFTIADFEKLFTGDAVAVPIVPSLRAIKNNHKTALATARQSVGMYNAMITRLEDEAQQWYAEATAVYPASTVEGDMIRNSVPTSSDYNPATVAPTVLPISSASVEASTAVKLNYPTTGGDGATLKMLQYRFSNEVDFGHDTPLIRPSQVVSDPTFEQATLFFRTKLVNSKGITYSPPIEVNL